MWRRACSYHVDLKQPVNGATYLRRGWCRLECWAYLSTNGLSKMFLYHADGRMECVMGKRNWSETLMLKPRPIWPGDPHQACHQGKTRLVGRRGWPKPAWGCPQWA